MTETSPKDSRSRPAKQPAQDAFPPLPICWPALTTQERADQLGKLTEWIRWLVGCYVLDHRTVPPCWAEHSALLEELSALRTAWLTAFATTSTGDAPLAWHTSFAACRQRLVDWAARTGCRSGEHRSDRLTPAQEQAEAEAES